MPQKLKFPDLNTSHVLIYPLWTYPQNFSPSFKYISCSYLSAKRHLEVGTVV